MTPVEFLARISAVIPPPRHPLVRYFGVFGPNCSWRQLCVPQSVHKAQTQTMASNASCAQVSTGAGAADAILPATGNHSSLSQQNDIRRSIALSATSTSGTETSTGASRNASSRWRLDWATLLKRTYDLDVLTCPCGGRLKAVELVTATDRAKELLEQSGMPAKPPPIARAQPATNTAPGGGASLWNRSNHR